MKLFRDIPIIVFVVLVFGFSGYLAYKYWPKPKPIPTIEHVSTKMDSAFLAYKISRFNDSAKLAFLEKRLNSLEVSQANTLNILDSLNRAKRKSPNKLPLK